MKDLKVSKAEVINASGLASQGQNPETILKILQFQKELEEAKQPSRQPKSNPNNKKKK